MPTAVHLPAIPITNNCTDKSARNGVVTAPTFGIIIPKETNPPGSVPTSDWLRPVDSGQNPTNPINASKSGCSFGSNTANLESDVTKLTGNGSANWKDALGNDLTGTYSLSMGGSSPNQYINLSDTNIENMAKNALISASDRARSLSAVNGTQVLSYVVGLGNTSSPPDTSLLKRVANTSDSSGYNTSYPPGDMIYATNNDELHAAFARLASEILRIVM
jgi:hypothetical protein